MDHEDWSDFEAELEREAKLHAVGEFLYDVLVGVLIICGIEFCAHLIWSFFNG